MPLSLRCYAKVNLTLEVLGRRPDGFHEVATLLHTISLADTLRVEPAEHLECRVEGLTLEHDENLVLRAAHLLRQETGSNRGARLTLQKRIPAAAGLGGGSSDAAATLAALNGLWQTRVRTTRLAVLAAQLGSDVPFFLRGGAAIARGRGEHLEWLPGSRPHWLVLLVPPHQVPTKTARLYAELRGEEYGTGLTTQRVAERLNAGLDIRPHELINSFEPAARRVFPGLDATWQAAERIARLPFHLSGAGPAIFTLCASSQESAALARALSRLDIPLYVARTVRKGRARATISYPKE